MGLDLASKATGIAVLTEVGLPLMWQTIDLPLVKQRHGPKIGDQERVLRAIKVADTIVQVARAYKVTGVGIEGYAYGAKFQAHQMGETAGIVKSQILMALKIPYEVIPPKTARKAVFGHGDVDKQIVIDIVTKLNAHLGRVPSSTHEADAWVVARALFQKHAKKG